MVLTRNQRRRETAGSAKSVELVDTFSLRKIGAVIQNEKRVDHCEVTREDRLKDLMNQLLEGYHPSQCIYCEYLDIYMPPCPHYPPLKASPVETKTLEEQVRRFNDQDDSVSCASSDSDFDESDDNETRGWEYYYYHAVTRKDIREGPPSDPPTPKAETKASVTTPKAKKSTPQTPKKSTPQTPAMRQVKTQSAHLARRFSLPADRDTASFSTPPAKIVACGPTPVRMRMFSSKTN